jgi:solute carrier family 25 protein 38
MDQKGSLLHLIGGATSGLLSCVLLQPFDLTKTRLQLNGNKNTNTILTIKEIVKNESLLGLWKGTIPTILRNVPGSGLYFYTLHLLRTKMTTLKYIPNDMINMTGGMIARVSVGLIMMPITVVKIRYESSIYNYNSIYGAFKSILQKEGIKGLFSGFGATVMRDAPFAGIYVYFYENIKSHITKNHIGIEIHNTMAVNMISGLIGGIAATFITQPFGK